MRYALAFLPEEKTFFSFSFFPDVALLHELHCCPLAILGTHGLWEGNRPGNDIPGEIVWSVYTPLKTGLECI